MDVNQPRLGSLGQVVGVAPSLGGLGHVAGVVPQDMGVNQPRLGSLGQVAGIAPRLGSLGQVAGFATDETNSLLSGVGIPGSQEVVALDLTGNGDVDALVFDTDGNGIRVWQGELNNQKDTGYLMGKLILHEAEQELSNFRTPGNYKLLQMLTASR